jgi:hypothetical protein
MARFWNITNHASAKWSPEQRDAARALASDPVDVPFPDVPVDADEGWFGTTAERLTQGIAPGDVACVQGDFVFSFVLVARLQRLGVRCVATASAREVAEEYRPDGSTMKTTRFVFRRFREYPDVVSHG